MATAHVTHVNAAMPKPKMVGNQVKDTAIDKHPSDGPVDVDSEGLVTDQVGNPRVHGGNSKALYVYAGEDYDWWAAELDRELRPGVFGENLTTRGMDISAALVGERWRVGTVTAEVSAPRIPCATFAAQMGVRGWPQRFSAAGRPGAYLRVLEPGAIGPGDEIEVLDRPEHDLTVAQVHEIVQHDQARASELLVLDALAENLQDWAGERVAAG
jgi:MOSC domain-containing protein YiiM